ncbi:MAG: hypothetical protein QNJ72_40490, partial [Pleurocapsa sp. MO_226.B13]|nr:hypothetical protein [Pleurocapsa sp. MO_226.B13]
SPYLPISPSPYLPISLSPIFLSRLQVEQKLHKLYLLLITYSIVSLLLKTHEYTKLRISAAQDPNQSISRP